MWFGLVLGIGLIILGIYRSLSEGEFPWLMAPGRIGLIIMGFILAAYQFRLGGPWVGLLGLVLILTGIVTGIIAIVKVLSDGSSSSSSSSGPSMGQAVNAWGERRKNSPHTCDTCTEYSHTNGKCKSGNHKSPTDSCSNWR